MRSEIPPLFLLPLSLSLHTSPFVRLPPHRSSSSSPSLGHARPQLRVRPCFQHFHIQRRPINARERCQNKGENRGQGAGTTRSSFSNRTCGFLREHVRCFREHGDAKNFLHACWSLHTNISEAGIHTHPNSLGLFPATAEKYIMIITAWVCIPELNTSLSLLL